MNTNKECTCTDDIKDFCDGGCQLTDAQNREIIDEYNSDYAHHES